jgi:hypothetical protein
MSSAKRVAFASAVFVLGACAIHPLPEDVTGVSTYYIVRQIRCETREAIIRSALVWLTTSDRIDAASRQIGFEFVGGTRPINTFHPKLFKEHARTILSVFYDTGIAYNYALEMTENNNLSADANLLDPFTRGKATLGVAALGDRQRLNLRSFTVTDTFSGLIRDVPDDYCTGQIVQENYIYPIAGKIGMEKVIQDFIRLTLFGRLAGPKDTPGGPAGPPTMVDSLEFTTTVSLSATPKVEFTPLGTSLRLSNASLTGRAVRKDVHKVTVGLAVVGAGLRQVGPVRSRLFAPLLTASGGAAEQAAAEAVNQVLTLQVFRPTIVVSP